jgi:hypothetical protein
MVCQVAHHVCVLFIEAFIVTCAKAYTILPLSRCYQQLKADPDDYFCFTMMENEDLFTGTFVPLGTRESLGLNSATAETCDAGMFYALSDMIFLTPCFLY